MPNANRRALFLDRDGTLIVDGNYLREPGQVRLLAGAGPALAKIKAHGFALVLISNQSGIGRGLITPQEAAQVHEAFVARLAEQGVELDAAFYCPHAPAEQCRCRKPSPEMCVRAAQELHLDLARSFMVGDKACDIEAGQRAGCRTILLRPSLEEETVLPFATGHFSCPLENPDLVARDWTEIVRYVLSSEGMRA